MDKKILLIICGGIAAYKSLELIRQLKTHGFQVRAIMTKSAQEFITPLSVGVLTANKVFDDLFSREDEEDVGHIRLARWADLIMVAPATADFMAKMAHGLANDLASTVVLASHAPIMLAPSMNPVMWSHQATKRNVELLRRDGVQFIGPHVGEMAESGEAGLGRMSEPVDIVAKILAFFTPTSKPLLGKKIIVTSGPTLEPLDPVRFISNRSSGKQGHAIAHACAQFGADVHLVSGPVMLADPVGVTVYHVETAHQMRDAVLSLLPADVVIMVAAVCDWRAETRPDQKIKKQPHQDAPVLKLTENDDILRIIGHHELRPKLVIGFAAETENLLENAARKLAHKNADMIVANNVKDVDVFNQDNTHVHLVRNTSVEDWGQMSKQEVAKKLAQYVAQLFLTH